MSSWKVLQFCEVSQAIPVKFLRKLEILNRFESPEWLIRNRQLVDNIGFNPSAARTSRVST